MKSKTPRKRFVLKGKQLLNKSGLDNVHQITLRARISAQTGYKYLHTPEEVRAVDMGVLAAILIDGFGLTEKQVLEMKIGDLFEIVN